MNNFPFLKSPFNNYNNYYNHYKKSHGYYGYSNLINRQNTSNLIDKTLHNKNNSLVNSNSNQNNDINNNTVQVDEKKDINNKNRSSKYNSFIPANSNFDFFSNTENPILEFMGIKLYLDDLIIIGILFLLYNENVKDEILFIILILLLLS